MDKRADRVNFPKEFRSLRRITLRASLLILAAFLGIYISVASTSQAEPLPQRTATATPLPNVCASSVPGTIGSSTAAATQDVVSQSGGETAQRALICQYYDLLNQNALKQLDDVVSADVADRNPFGGQRPGLVGLKDRLQIFRRGFPNLQYTVNDLLIKEDTVVSRVTAQGNLRGMFYKLQPTGDHFSFKLIEIFRIADGKIAEIWHVEDLLRVALGQVPTPVPSETPVPSTTPTSTLAPSATPTLAPTLPTTPNPNPAYLGVRLRAEKMDDGGVRIVEIFNGSPAVTARLMVGDLITAVNGQPLTSLKGPSDVKLTDTFFRLLGTHAPGDKIKLTLTRADTKFDVDVTLGVRPPGLISGNVQ